MEAEMNGVSFYLVYDNARDEFVPDGRIYNAMTLPREGDTLRLRGKKYKVCGVHHSFMPIPFQDDCSHVIEVYVSLI
jgi:hypothetical protein